MTPATNDPSPTSDPDDGGRPGYIALHTRSGKGTSGSGRNRPAAGRAGYIALHGRLTSAQLRARRRLDWLHDFEVGVPDLVTRRPVPRPVWLIAALARVPERTVRHGIAEARKLRDAHAHRR